MSDPAPTNLAEVALLREAIAALRASGCAVIEAGEQPGLYRIDNGPALTSGQLVSAAFELRLLPLDPSKR